MAPFAGGVKGLSSVAGAGAGVAGGATRVAGLAGAALGGIGCPEAEAAASSAVIPEATLSTVINSIPERVGWAFRWKRISSRVIP